MKLKTTNIQGQEYVMVHERIRAFHILYPNGKIEVGIDHVLSQAGRITMCCKVTPDIGLPERFFTGYSQEIEGSSNVNKTSFVENCETSAVGRALGFLGIGVETSIATAEEVARAIQQQEKKPRFTEIEGVKYPHVTDIISGGKVPNIPYIDEHAYIGQMYHMANANFIKTGEFKLDEGVKYEQPKNIPLHYSTFSLPKFLERCGESSKFVFRAAEVFVSNKEHLYCGTFDADGSYNGVPALFDFKKFKTIDKNQLDQYFMQLSAYYKAAGLEERALIIISLHPECPIEKAIIVKDKKEELARYWQMFLGKRVEFKNKFGV